MLMRRRTELGRAFQSFQGRGLVGPRALLSAVIATAALDLDRGGGPARSAARYFLSDLYRGHLAWLGLPPDFLPAGVARSDLAALAGASSTRPPRPCRKMSHIATG